MDDLQFPLTSYGYTIEEAKEDLNAVLAAMIDYHLTKKEVLPVAYKNDNLEFEFKYDIASIFAKFSMLGATNFAKKIKLNPSLLRQYKSGITIEGELKAVSC